MCVGGGGVTEKLYWHGLMMSDPNLEIHAIHIFRCRIKGPKYSHIDIIKRGPIHTLPFEFPYPLIIHKANLLKHLLKEMAYFKPTKKVENVFKYI